MKKTISTVTMLLSVGTLTACAGPDLSDPDSMELESLESASAGCNYNWSSPTNQCTGGVRGWKGGCAAADGMTYGGVPWSGHAYQWWTNGSAYRSSTPGNGYIVVFGPSNYNSNFGHVGVVTSISGQVVYFRSRNWKSGDYVGTVSEYLSACGGCQLYGYLNYF